MHFQDFYFNGFSMLSPVKLVMFVITNLEASLST